MWSDTMIINNIHIFIIIINAAFVCGGAVGVEVFSTDEVQDFIIDNHKLEYDIILLDIRTPFDVANGIIASSNCKPYHISYALDNWEERYKDLPKNIPIITYCNGGAVALEAAQFLVNNGYDKVGIINGGVQKYKGELVDSIYLKPWSDLPLPSYVYLSNIKYERSFGRNFTLAPKVKKEMFNLKGQRIISFLTEPTTPTFILERINNTGYKNIYGIRHFIENER
jgi:rhodanese-related sulfurtransferase